MIRGVPFVGFLLPLVAGIFCCYWFYEGFTRELLFLPFASVLFFVLFHHYGRLFRSYRNRWITGMAAIVFLFSVGWVLTVWALPSVVKNPLQVTASGRVVSVEEASGPWSRLVFAPTRVNEEVIPVKPGDRWLLMVKDGHKEIDIDAGQTIMLKGHLQSLPISGNPDGFEYGRYLFRQGIAGQMFVSSDSMVVMDTGRRLTLQAFSAWLRNWSISKFRESGIHGSSLDLLNALVLGERSGVDRELNDKFIRSGAIHLLAVSGLHVGIVYLFINYLFSFFFKSNNFVRLVLTIFLLFFYAFITGFSPSVTRAVLMFSLIQIGNIYLRHINVFNILALSAFIILLYNPLYLFHAGFWLSHLAVGGIVAFYPVIYGLVSFKFMVWRGVWSIISVSLAAQISTFPFSLWLFGAFPSYFLLTNLLLLPIMAPVLILAFFILATSSLPLVNKVLGAPLYELLGYIEGSVRWIESLPGAYLMNVWVSLLLMVLIYLGIVSWSVFFASRKPRYLTQGGIITLIILMVGLAQWTQKKRGGSLVVFNAGGELLIEVIDKGTCSGFISEGLSPTQKTYAASGYEKENVINFNPFIILPGKEVLGGSSVYQICTGEGRFCLVHGYEPVKIHQCRQSSEVLIVSGSPDVDLIELTQLLGSKKVIIASNCPVWKTREWARSLKKEGLSVHDVKSRGAYIVKIR